MNLKPLPVFFILICILFSCNSGPEKAAEAPTKTAFYRYVDPLIGTGQATTPSAKRNGKEDYAQVAPFVGPPYASTSWTPQTQATEQKCISPYYHSDSLLQGFRGSHWMSGSCTQDYGSVTFMPLSGELHTAPEARASAFSHSEEVAEPAFYQVRLQRYGITAEMTATMRSGLLYFTFPENKTKYMVIEPNSDEGEGFVQIDVEQQEVTGYNPVHRIYQGWGKPAGFSGYFVAQFDAPFAGYGTFSDSTIFEGETTRQGNGKNAGAWLQFDEAAVNVRVGMSFTSIEQARKNLQAETAGKSFEQVLAETRQTWEDDLARMSTSGGTEDQKKVFYTALWHARLMPRVFSDVDGSFPGFADNQEIHRAEGYDYYADFTTWDSYRTVHPLLTLIDPEREASIVQSLVTKAGQGGWLPIFPCWNEYTAGMIGDHVISVIGDAWLKGIEGFDKETAWYYMRKNAFETPADYETYKDGKGRRALDSYLQYSYIPLEDSVPEAFHKREQVSRTLEYAYDDFVLALVAKETGQTEDYEALLQRAANYRNVFDPAAGFVRGRYADGSWITPFEPKETVSFITEGTPYHYTWYVPQDPQGLAKLMGGNDIFVRRLDSLFSTGHYWHGNEPGHQSAWLYPFAGAAWRTQQQVREILKTEYSTGPGGLSGNDDVGQMSAWAVAGMAGFYPVCPGLPYYVLGSPVFDEISIKTPATGKTFTIKTSNNSEENMFVQSASLNGEPLERAWLWHHEMLQGGELLLQMGPEPNRQWATNPESFPPSMTNMQGFWQEKAAAGL